MFAIARFIVKNKVGAAAVVALGVFALTPGAEEEAPQSSNPWSTQAKAAASSNKVMVSSEGEGGFMDDMMAEASDMLDEAGINPVSQVEENSERLEGAAGALGNANR